MLKLFSKPLIWPINDLNIEYEILTLLTYTLLKCNIAYIHSHTNSYLDGLLNKKCHFYAIINFVEKKKKLL